jgi:hypothetical protein
MSGEKLTARLRFNGRHASESQDESAMRRIAERKEAADLIENLEARALAAEEERDRLRTKLNTPELHDFAKAVVLEAAHQRERWGADHDAGKEPQDWFWLLGYLGGKALHAAKAGDADKALHHCISSAAVLANWHAAILGLSNTMRPGIDPEERGYAHAR